jgi:site-specific recombinase XerD
VAVVGELEPAGMPQHYLGHRSIMSTARYTALTPNRFKNFWKD